MSSPGWKDLGVVTISGMKEKGAMAECPDLEKVVKFANSLSV